MNIKKLIEQKDLDGLRRSLAVDPTLANKGVTIPYELFCMTAAHPLHRICDAVFAKKMTDDEAIEMAKIFLEFGADIDGDKNKGEGTPLMAAASLHAEKLGIFFIERGADVKCVYERDGSSALHWAAFCGRDKLVDKLIQTNAPIDEPDYEYNSTPLGWAIHALSSNDMANALNQRYCIKLLLKAGADPTKLGQGSQDHLHTLAKHDQQLRDLVEMSVAKN